MVLTGDEDGPNSEANGGEVLLHVPSGQLINWAEDDEGKLRFFIQPIVEDGSVDPELVIPLPMGTKQFFGEQASPDDDDDDGDDEGGKPLTEDERLEKEWKEREEERKRRWAEEDEERELEFAEREKELQLELELKELDAELEAAVDEAELQVLLNCSYLEMSSFLVCTSVLCFRILLFTIIIKFLQLKLEELYGVEGGREDDDGEVIEARREKDSIVEEARSAEGDVKDEEEDEDEEDDEDPKPRSFGKVAMASPQEGSADSSGNPPFPTVFASISVVSQVCRTWLLTIVRFAALCQN